jgi:L-aspartate oxidase
MKIKSDFLIIGSGIAGLSFALKIAEKFPDKKIIIITKGKKEESNTKYAQGGIATVYDLTTDSYEEHIKDTLVAGDYLNDPEVVEMVIKQAKERLDELLSWGVDFDKNENGEFDLGKEGGHSKNRIFHHKDITGFEIERSLLKKVQNHKNIHFYDFHYAIDLITEHQVFGEMTSLESEKTIFGAYVLNEKNKEINTFIAPYVLLATGGSGQVYKTTTNPFIATGDGIGMAYRAKAQIADMEFIQFHPTALYNPGESPAFLISEAVRGFGGQLYNLAGERFMEKYDSRLELAPRDIVAKAIDSEMKLHGDDYVLLDVSHLNYDKFIKHFPNITKKCQSLGIDIRKDRIPVVPAAHYMMGGVVIDKKGHTSIKNLYASGEVTRSGLHGANRLASNSLLEALVFSHNAVEDIYKSYNPHYKLPSIPEWIDTSTYRNMEKILIKHDLNEVKTIMTNYVGIVRSNERLLRALRRLYVLYQDNKRLYDHSEITTDLLELRNLITTAYLIVEFSRKRKENRGGFYNIDLKSN